MADEADKLAPKMMMRPRSQNISAQESCHRLEELNNIKQPMILVEDKRTW